MIEQSEKLVRLTPDDIAELKARNVPHICGFVLAVAFAIAFVLYLFIRADVVNFALVVMCLLSTLFLLVMFRLAWVNAAVYREDIREGQKKVIINRIESQRTETRQNGIPYGPYFYGWHRLYYVKIGGEEYPVSEKKYSRLKPGQLVEVHLGKYSGTLIQMIPLQEDRHSAFSINQLNKRI
jgi:hypothetical protein